MSAKLKPAHFSGASNIHGKGPNSLVTKLNGKMDVAALTPIAAITTANATDLASAITLANETKAKFNTLLAALKAAVPV